MNNDVVLIEGLRQAFRSSSGEFCKAFSDLADASCADTIRSILDGQLRIAAKLAQLQNLYSSSKSNKDYASAAEIAAFKHSQGITEK